MRRWKGWATAGIAVLFAAALLAPTAGSALARDWPQFQSDAIHSGQTADPAPTLTPVLKWVQNTWHSGTLGIETPPIIAGDMVYVHAGNGLWAFRKESGELLWRQTIPGTETLQTSTPAYGEGKIFIATFDGFVRAYDALTGAPLWERGIGQRLFQCPITYHEGRIYLGEGGSGGSGNRYFCLDAEGNLVWEYASDTAGYLWSGASVVGDYLVFANHDAVLTSLKRTDGTPVDRLRLHDLRPDAGRARASVAYRNGFVYTTSEAGLDSGYLWKIGFDPNTGRFHPEAGWSAPIGFSTSTPVIYDGKIYVGEGEHGQDGSLICLDEATGAILWAFPVEGGVKSSPALSLQPEGAYLYFPTSMNNGFLYCLKADGHLRWKWNPPEDDAYILQGAAVSDGMVFLGTCNGKLYALGEERDWPQFQRNAQNSGLTFDAAPESAPGPAWKAFTVHWSTHGIDVTPIVVDGKVIVIDCREKVWAFDLASGAYLWSTQLPEGKRYTLATPAAGEGKIFCATDGGYIYALDQSTGSILWGGRLTRGINQEEELSTQVTYADGRVFVGSWEGDLYCLDAKGNGPDPKVLWSYRSGGRHDWFSAAAVIGDWVLFGNSEGEIVSLNWSTGAPADSLNLGTRYGITPGSIRSGISPDAAQDRLYLTSKNGYLHSVGFDPMTGRFLPEAGWIAAIDAYSQSTPALWEGKVYVASGDFNKPGALYCFDVLTGAVLWRYPFGSFGSAASPAISIHNGSLRIYVTTNDAYDRGGVYCFDGEGNLRWGYVPPPDLNEMMLQGVAIADGKVLFGNDAGWLFALGDTPPLPDWDVNADGTVNLLDLVRVGLRYGETGAPGWIPEDVDRSGAIDILDLAMIGDHFGE